MKFLFLCKRHPQGRDLLSRPFGRFFYLPYQLAQQGHDVTILLLGYDDAAPLYCHINGINWYMESLRPLTQSFGPLAYIKRANMLIQTYKPDWVVGFSDTWFGILAVYFGQKYNIKSLIDAYDNYESYIPWAKPLHWLWRSSLKNATALSAAGPHLAELMNLGRSGRPAEVIPMAADPVFLPIVDTHFRDVFGLQNDIPLIGYCGSLFKNRGVEVLFTAMARLIAQMPNLKLIISGRQEKGLEIPASLRNSIIHIGYIADEQVPLFINAVDVLLVLNKNSNFGNYSYPIKLYEAMRCKMPVLASDVMATRWILKDHPECLVEIGDPQHLASRLQEALTWKRIDYTSMNDWQESANLLLNLLEDE